MPQANYAVFMTKAKNVHTNNEDKEIHADLNIAHDDFTSQQIWFILAPTCIFTTFLWIVTIHKTTEQII